MNSYMTHILTNDYRLFTELYLQHKDFNFFDKKMTILVSENEQLRYKVMNPALKTRSNSLKKIEELTNGLPHLVNSVEILTNFLEVTSYDKSRLHQRQPFCLVINFHKWTMNTVPSLDQWPVGFQKHWLNLSHNYFFLTPRSNFFIITSPLIWKPSRFPNTLKEFIFCMLLGVIRFVNCTVDDSVNLKGSLGTGVKCNLETTLSALSLKQTWGECTYSWANMGSSGW